VCANHDLGNDRDAAVTFTVNAQISLSSAPKQSAEHGRLATLRPGYFYLAVSFCRYLDLVRTLLKVTW
jgi:hypothetical protein